MGIASCPKKWCGKAGFPNQNLSNHIFLDTPRSFRISLAKSCVKSLLNPLKDQRVTVQNCQLCGLKRPEVPPQAAPCLLLCKHSLIVEAPDEVNCGSAAVSLFLKMERLKSSKWPNSYGSTDNIPHFSTFLNYSLFSPWQGERKVHASLPLNQKK